MPASGRYWVAIYLDRDHISSHNENKKSPSEWACGDYQNRTDGLMHAIKELTDICNDNTLPRIFINSLSLNKSQNYFL